MKRLITRIRTTTNKRRLALSATAVAAVGLNWGVAQFFGWSIATNPNNYSVSDATATGYLIGFACSFAVIDLVRWMGKAINARFNREAPSTTE